MQQKVKFYLESNIDTHTHSKRAMAAILKKFASALPHDDDIIYTINRFYTTFRNYENEIKILRFLKKQSFSV